MIVSIGTDLLEIDRIERLLTERRAPFLDRVYTAAERAYCDSRKRPGESYAARFAAKEAISKCLRTGRSEGVAWRDLEILRDAATGAVEVRLHGTARDVAARVGIDRILVSMSHSQSHAIAFATALGSTDEPRR